MSTDPEPRYCIIVENAEGSIAKCYPHRPDVFHCIDALEMERWMKRVVLPYRKDLRALFLTLSGRGLYALQNEGSVADFTGHGGSRSLRGRPQSLSSHGELRP